MPLAPLIISHIVIILAFSALVLFILRRRVQRRVAKAAAAAKELPAREPEFYLPVMPRVLPLLFLTFGNTALFLLWALAINYALSAPQNQNLTHGLFLVALPLFGLPLVGLFYAYKRGIFHENSR